MDQQVYVRFLCLCIFLSVDTARGLVPIPLERKKKALGAVTKHTSDLLVLGV